MVESIDMGTEGRSVNSDNQWALMSMDLRGGKLFPVHIKSIKGGFQIADQNCILSLENKFKTLAKKDPHFPSLTMGINRWIVWLQIAEKCKRINRKRQQKENGKEMQEQETAIE